MEDQHRCDVCDCEIPAGTGYVVRIEVYADPEMPPMSSAEIAQTDFQTALAELMDQMKEMSADDLQDAVHRRFEYHLCPQCQRRYLANPLGLPRQVHVGRN